MQAGLRCCVVFLVALTAVPVLALEDLDLYDNFNAKLIDPDKWVGGGSRGTEASRKIQGGRLRLSSRGYGTTTSNSGTLFNSQELRFSNPTAITAVAATVRVTKVQATGCTLNSEATAARAQIQGSFFNTAPPTPGSSLNDVRAIIRINRRTTAPDPPNVLQVEASVFQCTIADCSTTMSLGFKGLGPINVGQTAKLLLQWDQVNNQFIFQRDDEPEMVIVYTVSDTSPPGNQFKSLQASPRVANCTAEPRPVGFIDASFDNVFVNESAVP